MAIVFGYLGALVLIGALLCFKGRDLFRPMIAVFAFWMVYSTIMGLVKGGDDKDIIIAILAGLVAALLSGFVLKIGAFLSGMVMGLSFGRVLFDMFPQMGSVVLKVIFLVVITILVGILTVKALDHIITVATAGLGAILIAVPAVFLVFGYRHLGENVSSAPLQTITNVNDSMFVKVAAEQPLIVLCAAGVLLIAGIIVQYKTNHTSHEW